MNKVVRHILIFAICLFALCVNLSPVRAQDYAEEEEAVGLLDKVMTRLEQKQRYIPTVSGAVQIGYLYQNSPSLGTSSNSFTFNTARLNIKGKPFDWFHYNLQVDFANKVRILDFNLNFHPLATTQARSQYINFWAGQSKTPLTLESQLGPATFEAVEYSQVITALCGYSNALSPEIKNMAGGRDIGLALYGYALRVPWGGKDHDFFEYKVGVYNGSGMNCLDQDKMKDVSAAFYIHPTAALTLGGSFYTGAYRMKVYDGKDTLDLQTRRDRWAGSLRYDDKAHWLIRAEYVGGKTHGQYSDGWYAAFQYTINPATFNQWAILVKYDAYRYNMKRLPDYCNHQILAGINYRPMSWLYVQAHYSYRMDFKQHTITGQHHQFQLTACLIY